MKIVIIWNTDESTQMYEDLVSIRDQYEVWSSLEVSQDKENKQNLLIPAMVLEEESISFKDTLSQGEKLEKDALRELVEELFWISTSSGCSTWGCWSCSGC